MNARKSEGLSDRGRTAVPWEYVEAYTFRAADLLKAGDAPKAIVALEKVLAMDPGNEPALLIRGALWLLQGRPGKAIREFSKALIRNGRNPAAYYKRGEAHQLLGHFRAAIADYSQVLLLVRDHREALINRAVLYSYFHETDRALSDFDRLMASDPRIAKAIAHWGVKRFLKDGQQGRKPRSSPASPSGAAPRVTGAPEEST